MEGEIESILIKNKKAVIRIKSDRETESHTVPASGIRVDKGDLIFPGDTLATYKKWRIGILTQGLWLTLKVSIIAIVFGILIGLFTGIARISSNPALKWSAITYIEFIRGSPLLVQIFRNDICSVHAVYYPSPGPAPNSPSPRRPIHQSHQRFISARYNCDPGIDQGDARSDHYQPTTL
jgi:hypothetical protein